MSDGDEWNTIGSAKPDDPIHNQIKEAMVALEAFCADLLVKEGAESMGDVRTVAFSTFVQVETRPHHYRLVEITMHPEERTVPTLELVN